MNELQRLIFQQACQPIYVEPLLPDDREALMAFSQDIATADLKPGEFELVMVDLIRLREACRLRYQEHREAQRYRTRASNAAKARAAKRAAEDPNAWMRPIFDKAWAELDAECSKVIGHPRLLLRARRIAGPGHPDHYRRDKLSKRHAQAYLASLKSPVVPSQ